VNDISVQPAWTEQERLAALRNYAILDTSPEEAFDNIVRLTGLLLNAPIVAVNLIDASRQWFKSEIGLGVREMPLDDSICKFALLETDRMVVPDTHKDPRFDCNPLVTGGPGLRFYAGELLKTPEGLPLGTLCILDTVPRPEGLTEIQAFTLRTLAQQVWSQIELRKIVHEQEQVLAEQRRIQAELYDSRERYRNMFSQAATGMVEVDTDGRIAQVNQKFCEMVGYDRADLLGQSVLVITAPDSVDTTLDALKKAEAGAAGVVVQKQYRKKDGSLIWATSSVSALRGAAGEYRGLVAIVVDITESRQAVENLKKLAADLSEADQRKSEFLATLAHELRNPLAPISSGLGLLKLGGDNVATVAKIRQMMERQVGQMVRLIDDLLDVARISGGKILLKKSLVDLKSVMTSAIETSMPFIEGGGHKLVVNIPHKTMMLDADAMRISQVLSNLLNNASKYTPAGGRIDISARQEEDGGAVLITVTDNGVGIPAESLLRIFDMFSQVRQNLSRAQGGLGVGLSLVRRLVEMHGGTVVAMSGGPGTGSAFRVRLPLATNPASPASQDSADAAGSVPHRQFRLLVVDDNTDAAEMLGAMMELQGHVTRIASNGVDALRIAPEFHPQIVFLDIGMPGMNGYETATAFRKIPGFEKVILVALTGWGDENDRARSKLAGFDFHLTKPAELAAIDSLLEKIGAPRKSDAI
jgi:PAS domain S-box-containing protein